MSNWKTDLYQSLINAQARQAEHDQTVRTLQDLIQHDPERADLYRGCLDKLRTGYDL